MKSYDGQRWVGTGAQVVGALIMASKTAHPVVAYLIMLVGSCCWLYVAIRWRDKALAALNVAFTLINIVGLVAWGLGQW